MFSTAEFANSLFKPNVDFDHLALSLFYFQYEHNPLYRQYLQALQIAPQRIKESAAIPCLPIGFFKTHEVKTGDFAPALVFESSGTTQMVPSRCLIKSPALYARCFRAAFSLFYGAIDDYTVIGLLPSYLERKNASLVYMVQDLIRQSGKKESGDRKSVV